jgi:hypothetical protein
MIMIACTAAAGKDFFEFDLVNGTWREITSGGNGTGTGPDIVIGEASGLSMTAAGGLLFLFGGWDLQGGTSMRPGVPVTIIAVE